MVYQSQVVSAAQTLAGQLNSLDEFLNNLETRIIQEAQVTIKQVNELVATIASLNENIQRQEVTGTTANNLRDKRDQCIMELSKLVSVQTQTRDFGVVDLSIGGIPVLFGTSPIPLEVGFNEESGLGVAISGQSNYITDIDGGKLGGLLSLKNGIISDIHNDINNLAGTVIKQFNQYHVQGVGTEGSFNELTGQPVSSENLADFVPPLTDGNIYIRIINKQTGEITRAAVPVDVAADSLSTIAASISSITGLSASVIDKKLHIQANSGYEFDFLPCSLPIPTDSDFSGASSPPDISVSGIYSGADNQTLTFSVSGSGSVGNGTLELVVNDNNGQTIAILNIGSGYAAGDELDVGNGIKITLGAGDLAAGNTFNVDAFAQTDTTGLLAAAGINTFFSGKDASDIAVCSDIIDMPGRIATAASSDMTDNVNILRLAGLRNEPATELNSMTTGEFYRQLVTDIARELSSTETRQENIQAMVQNLVSQQSQLSGVNINDEAAQMLLFEQMFQAMSKYLSTLQNSMSTMMEIL
jgi:flagellar hook-associated protein 1